MPQSSQDRFTQAIDRLHGAMNDRIDRIALNLRAEGAPGRTKTTADEQLQTYLPMRQNPEAWQQIVQQQGIKGALKYYRTMEGVARRKFESLRTSTGLPDDVKFQELPLPQPIIDALMQAAQMVSGQAGGGLNAASPDPAAPGPGGVPMEGGPPTPTAPPVPAALGSGGPPDAGMGY